MIEKVHLKYFKRFADQSFDLTNPVVLAGPNNSGKTTLLQAIATWSFAFNKWREKKTSAAKRNSISLTRKEFAAMPLQRLNLLWTDSATALRKSEGGGRGAATPRILEITLEGRNGVKNEQWSHTMEFRYANSEMLYARPKENSSTEAISVVHIPSFSGIETEEKVHTPDYQEWLIGQGKPGDITRNLMADVSNQEYEWQRLSQDIEDLFGYRLLKPEYEGRPFILCQYLPGRPPERGLGGLPKLDIASAGSGFLQALLLLSFFYARPSTVLLIDEPDAHLHVNLQNQIYTHLQKIAAERKCQLIMATHSEVIIDGTPENKIISFYGKPHLLTSRAEKDEVREALKRLTPMDILQSENGKVLYVEGNSDFNILRILSEKLDHPLKEWFKDCPFYTPIRGSDARTARNHFFALKSIHTDISGILILDGDNKNFPNHEITAEGLKILRWKRYEIENYLLHPELIKRFATDQAGGLFALKAEEEMKNQLPPAIIKSPLVDHEYLRTMPVSKRLIPEILKRAEIDIQKKEYYKIAEKIEKQEIHPEIKEKLDEIAKHFGIWEICRGRHQG